MRREQSYVHIPFSTGRLDAATVRETASIIFLNQEQYAAVNVRPQPSYDHKAEQSASIRRLNHPRSPRTARLRQNTGVPARSRTCILRASRDLSPTNVCAPRCSTPKKTENLTMKGFRSQPLGATHACAHDLGALKYEMYGPTSL